MKAELPGYRCYLPAHPCPRVQLTPKEIIEQYFPGVALKRPIEQIESHMDISRITADTGP